MRIGTTVSRVASTRASCWAAGLIAAAISSAAGAADSGFYIGVNVGESDFDLGGSLIGRPVPVLVATTPITTGGVPGTIPRNILVPVIGAGFVTPTSRSDVDQTDTTFSASLGYTFNRYVGLELSYADLGELRSTSAVSFGSLFQGQPPLTLLTRQKLSVETVSISLLGTLPLGERWTLFARTGYAYSESETTITSGFSNPVVGTTPARLRDDASSDDFVIGAGVGFKLSTRWSLRADYERIFDAGNSFGGTLDVDTLGLSAIFRL